MNHRRGPLRKPSWPRRALLPLRWSRAQYSRLPVSRKVAPLRVAIDRDGDLDLCANAPNKARMVCSALSRWPRLAANNCDRLPATAAGPVKL